MFETTRRLASPWTVQPEAASYVSFKKPLCKLDSPVELGAPQGVQEERE